MKRRRKRKPVKIVTKPRRKQSSKPNPMTAFYENLSNRKFSKPKRGLTREEKALRSFLQNYGEINGFSKILLQRLSVVREKQEAVEIVRKWIDNPKIIETIEHWNYKNEE